MINQDLDIVVFSKNNNIEKLQITQRKYRHIFLYEFSTSDKILLKDKIQQIAPDILHIHADKALFSEICKDLSIPCVITAHHGGITCPAGALLNYKDEICKTRVCQKACLPCVLKNTKGGYALYPVLKMIPESSRLSISRLFEKLPFIYYVSPITHSPLNIEKKMKDWEAICENVSSMIAPSYAIAGNMMLNGLDASKIEIVPHGIPVSPIENNIVTPDIPNRPIGFFYTGRIDHVKGIHVLLEAFAKLNPDKCELHLFGDIWNKYARHLIKKYAGNRNIVFHGKMAPEAIVSKIRGYDILIHPTICLEIFGLNIAEALAEGKPVIATRCGGAEMQIKEGENGILITPNSVAELFHAMDWAVNHLDDMLNMSKNAPLGVISIEEHVKRIRKIYENLF